MKTTKIGFIAGPAFLLLAYLLVSNLLYGQGDLIDAKGFMTLYQTDQNLVVVDASGNADFEKKHIKGAVNIPYSMLNRESDGVRGLVKQADELAALLAANGLSNAATIVVYDDGSMKAASRVYWVLKYAGAEKVKLLRREAEAWEKAKIPLTKKVAKPLPGNFVPKAKLSVYAGIADVESGKAALVDARSPGEFDGSSVYSKGHLPGAVNINYQDVFDKNGSFKSKDEIEDLFKSKGLNENSQLIIYCHSGVRATVLFVAATNILGWDKVKVYDGSYIEWATKGKQLVK